jgi:lipopolysaccharide transport system ATP-binding protein
MSSNPAVTPAAAPGADPAGDLAIAVADLSKTYQIYDLPRHRLWQSLWRGRRRFYREFHALTHVSFDVRRGEVVGIIGRNGSGKSTLLQLVCGTLTPSAGRVVAKGRIAALLELGAGFNEEFTGRENVYLNGAIMGLTTAEVDARYARIVEFADIGEFLDQPLKTYSTGMVVRLAFAVIAHVDADVLVIDEALAVGDVFFVQKCMRFLRDFMTRGTILFVSHDTGAIVNLCHRAIWLHKGEVMVDGSPKDVAEAYLQHLAEDAFGAAPRLRLESDEAAAPQQRSFGRGGARIAGADLVDGAGSSVQSISGGETVTLRIRAEAVESLSSPIVGFIVKDRLGQVLFSDNTFAHYAGRPFPLTAGQMVEARFTFVMPKLTPGEYAVGVAIADGTQASHVQHHWIHEALVIRSVATGVVNALMAIPMLDVSVATAPS